MSRFQTATSSPTTAPAAPPPGLLPLTVSALLFVLVLAALAPRVIGIPDDPFIARLFVIALPLGAAAGTLLAAQVRAFWAVGPTVLLAAAGWGWIVWEYHADTGLLWLPLEPTIRQLYHPLHVLPFFLLAAATVQVGAHAFTARRRAAAAAIVAAVLLLAAVGASRVVQQVLSETGLGLVWIIATPAILPLVALLTALLAALVTDLPRRLFHRLWPSQAAAGRPADGPSVARRVVFTVGGGAVTLAALGWAVVPLLAGGDRTARTDPSLPPAIAGSDGARMVLIPAGPFRMGDATMTVGSARPELNITLPDYYIDVYEVTIARYAPIAAKVGLTLSAEVKRHLEDGQDNLPATGIPARDAWAYCRQIGKRLPTEAEWEKAARGPKGQRYPWGDEADLSRANTPAAGLGKLVAVGSFPAGVSPYGVHDMLGNALEWVGTALDRNSYPRSARAGNGHFLAPPFGSGAALARGGSYAWPAEITAAMRLRISKDRLAETGFRCAADPSQVGHLIGTGS